MGNTKTSVQNLQTSLLFTVYSMSKPNFAIFTHLSMLINAVVMNFTNSSFFKLVYYPAEAVATYNDTVNALR